MLIAIIIVLVYEWKCDEGMIIDAYKHNASTCISKLLATALTCSNDPSYDPCMILLMMTLS